MISYSIHFCDNCSLGIFNEFIPINGQGENTDIMIIGSTPNATDIKHNKPFYSKSGKMLRRELKKYKLEDKCYFTSVIKCKTPNNRPPRLNEIKVCKRWLFKEIQLYKPKIILLFGIEAINLFFPNIYYVKHMAWKYRLINKTVIGCSYNMSYIFKNNDINKDFTNFIERLVKIYQHLNPYHLITY